MAHKTQGFSHGLNGFNGWGANKLPYKCAPSVKSVQSVAKKLLL